MKICHVSYHAASGGGAIAAMRLHRALKGQGADSVFLAVEPDNCPDAISIATTWERKKLLWKQRLLWRLYQLQHSRNFTAHSFDVLPSGFVPRILAHKPDVVHLHVVNGEMLSIGEIAELSRRVKLVWTLHDSWPFCGTEQHPRSDGNDRYIHGYTRENKEDPGIDFDRRVWEHKARSWDARNFHFIAPSHWIGTMMKNSRIFADSPMRVIGNTLDTAVFLPMDRIAVRRRLGLPADKFLIGFGASSLTDINKGGNELAAILGHLAAKTHGRVELATAGNGAMYSPIKVNPLGYIDSEPAMAAFYQSCDLFLLPSKYDNLPNMILESMACGTPVAAFDTGGIGDMVKPDCGLLAPAFDSKRLAEMILAYIDSNAKLDAAARSHIESNYSPPIIAKAHQDLYHSC